MSYAFKELSILVKPASSLCNLRCQYCFYLETARCRAGGCRGLMSHETLKCLLEQVQESVEKRCTLAFQGGEPTLAGLDFFRDAVRIQKDPSPHQPEFNWAIQTNGLLIDSEWADFLSANHFLTGISLDGPAEIHNANRMASDGKGSFSRTLRATELLKRANAPFNILSVVSDDSYRRAASIYGFFRKHGFRYLQFIPCLGDRNGRGALAPDRYAHFLAALFDLWASDCLAGKGSSIRVFDNWLTRYLGEPAEMCGMNGSCSLNLVIEADGSVYPCDFYCDDAHLLGNVHEQTFDEMLHSSVAQCFLEEGDMKSTVCRTCKWRNLCGGGCRRYRESESGPVPTDYYCEAYRRIFETRFEKIKSVASLIARNGGYPSELI
jgi:uncharacterized protein